MLLGLIRSLEIIKLTHIENEKIAALRFMPDNCGYTQDKHKNSTVNITKSDCLKVLSISWYLVSINYPRVQLSKSVID